MKDNYDGHAGSNRREPKVTQQDYLTLDRLSKQLREAVERHLLEQNGTILDLGCGKKPYQPFFRDRSDLYVGVDISLGELVDVLCAGEALPFKKSSFSVSLCTQVLEHTDKPRVVIDEIFRVLKPSGLLFLSTHGNWPTHGAPHDYWRWTEHGLKKLLMNFHIHAIRKCGGPVASIIQLLELFVPAKSLGVIIIVLLNLLGDSLDSNVWLNAKLPDLIANYFVVARKTEEQKV